MKSPKLFLELGIWRSFVQVGCHFDYGRSFWASSAAACRFWLGCGLESKSLAFALASHSKKCPCDEFQSAECLQILQILPWKKGNCFLLCVKVNLTNMPFVKARATLYLAILIVTSRKGRGYKLWRFTDWWRIHRWSWVMIGENEPNTCCL